jgi:hypothetical protein
MAVLSRRRAISSLVAVTGLLTGAVGGLIGIGGLISPHFFVSKSYSQGVKKPAKSQISLEKNVYDMVSGVYEDAKTLGVPLKENYVKDVSAEIWPEVKSIAERHFVITDN